MNISQLKLRSEKFHDDDDDDDDNDNDNDNNNNAFPKHMLILSNTKPFKYLHVTGAPK